MWRSRGIPLTFTRVAALDEVFETAGEGSSNIHITKVKVKVNQSRYRPVVAQRVPGS